MGRKEIHTAFRRVRRIYTATQNKMCNIPASVNIMIQNKITVFCSETIGAGRSQWINMDVQMVILPRQIQ